MPDPERKMNAMELLKQRAAEGRRPALDAEGNVRGYRSKPGAPLANARFGEVNYGPSGATPQGAWDDFFNKPTNKNPQTSTTPSLAPEAAPDASGMAKALNNPRPFTTPPITAQNLYQKANQSNEYFMGGINTNAPGYGGIKGAVKINNLIKSPYGTGRVNIMPRNTMSSFQKEDFVKKIDRDWQGIFDSTSPSFDSLLPSQY